jgi:transcriptional regulator with XRE-family HTH domain
MANKSLVIKQICKNKGITLDTLAKKLGIERTSLAQAMSRNVFSMDKLDQIADALGVSIPELFEDASTITCPHCGKKIHINVD